MNTNLHNVSIDELMRASSVAFGTSGARGLVTDMTDSVCYAYTSGFLQYLNQINELPTNKLVGIAGDLRPSSPRIMEACAQAIKDYGLYPIFYGYIPTPALAVWGLIHKIPSLMITGSHIPDDRNGIKFNKITGEILKIDEAGIRSQIITLPQDKFTATGALASTNTELCALSEINTDAACAYRERYLNFFPANCLSGLRVLIYEHSSVARDALHDILNGLGAKVTTIGRSDLFIPVDTEAIRPEDRELACIWGSSGNYDCIVSTDGDGDRPLIADEHGEWLRGDIVGILTAYYLKAQSVATPVSSNTALELSGWFSQIQRTCIGSPFVIAGMIQMAATEFTPVVGYEANGGFLLQSPITRNQRILPPLPTRDALIAILSVLLLAKEQGCTVSHLQSVLPQRFTASGRLKNFPTELSRSYITTLINDHVRREAVFIANFGPISNINVIDGLRLTFTNGDILHLRPSGNAPEVRVYTEAASQQRAECLNQQGLNLLENWLIQTKTTHN